MTPRLLAIDGRPTVELVDPNDGARSRWQYRRRADGLERRVLTGDGEPLLDTGSPWERLPASDVAAMYATRGAYHPILDPLGL